MLRFTKLLQYQQISCLSTTTRLGILCILFYLLSSCQVYLPAYPLEQKIHDIKWSPDGKHLAFIYQNGVSSTRSFSVYTIDVNGLGLKDVLLNHQTQYNYLIHWISNHHLITTDFQSVSKINLDGQVQELFFHPSFSENKFSLSNICSLSDGKYTIVNQSIGLPGWFDISMTTPIIQGSNFSSLENPFKEPNNHISSFNCSPSGTYIYLSSLHYDVKQKIETNIFAVAQIEIDSQLLKFQNFISFNPFKYLPAEEIGKSEYRFLGWKDEHILIFGFLKTSRSFLSVYEYNILTQETHENKEIRVVGEFSPDFQKVAYISTSDDGNYLTISRPNGTNVQRLLKIENLPKGTLSL